MRIKNWPTAAVACVGLVALVALVALGPESIAERVALGAVGGVSTLLAALLGPALGKRGGE